MNAPPHILVFDSGVGALSIIAEIRRALPLAGISYASDNGFFPYGTKAEEELVERVDRVLHALVERLAPDIIVVACNTASTVALPRIREHFSMPIVGVVPAIKPAAQLSATKVIGLLATPATVNRPYTRQLIQDFAADCHIIPLGSSTLVELAEWKLRGKGIDPAQLRAVLQPLLDAPLFPRMDTVVLACTHFPLLREELQQALDKSLRWVDSGEAIARRVTSLLGPSALSPASQPPRHRSIFTAATPEVEQLRQGLAKHLPGDIEFVAL